MRSSTFLCLLGLAFFFQSFTPSDAGEIDSMCNLLGGFYVLPEYCFAVFKQDPRSATADRQALGVIGADIEIKNTTNIKQKAEELLKNATDPLVKHRLEILLTIYDNTLRGLEWSKKSVAGGFRTGPYNVVSQIREFAARAANELNTGGFGSLTKDNADFFNLSILMMAVFHYV